jgi:hypothetical protein
MAYSMDFVCQASYAVVSGKVVTHTHASSLILVPRDNQEVTHITVEVFRITFKGKTMDECFTLVHNWINSNDGKLSMSIAFSEFGIDPADKSKFYLNYWREKTPKVSA